MTSGRWGLRPPRTFHPLGTSGGSAFAPMNESDRPCSPVSDREHEPFLSPSISSASKCRLSRPTGSTAHLPVPEDSRPTPRGPKETDCATSLRRTCRTGDRVTGTLLSQRKPVCHLRRPVPTNPPLPQPRGCDSVHLPVGDGVWETQKHSTDVRNSGAGLTTFETAIEQKERIRGSSFLDEGSSYSLKTRNCERRGPPYLLVGHESLVGLETSPTSPLVPTR